MSDGKKCDCVLDQVEFLRQQLAEEKAAREKAERARDNAIQEARARHLEAETQRATVLDICNAVGVPPNDWLVVSLVRHEMQKLRDRAERAERDRDSALTVRPEVHAFAREMEAKLAANDHKSGWQNDSPWALLGRLDEELIELRNVVKIASCGDECARGKVLGEAADVANFAMMVADVHGGLSTSSANHLIGRHADCRANEKRMQMEIEHLRRALNLVESYEVDWARGTGENVAVLTDIAALALNSKQGAPIVPEQTHGGPVFDLVGHLQHQMEWSRKTFGPGLRTSAVLDHIRKELDEIESNPSDLVEWIDVVLLAFDGAWRIGSTPEEICSALGHKLRRNMARKWPDWRSAPPYSAIEHVRGDES